MMKTRSAVRGARCAGLVLGAWGLLLTATACGGSSTSRENLRASGSERSPGVGAAGNPAHRAPPTADRRTVLFVGTSLTAGQGLEPDSAFPQMIGRKIDSLRMPFDVVNAGVSGETTAGLLRRMNWLLRAPFDVVVLESGANDGLRGTPVATVEANLQRIVDLIKSARPDATIVLVQMEALPNLGERYTSEFHAVFPAIARRNGLVLLPFLLDGVAGRRELNQPDGIHPNLAGERIVAENMWRALKPVLERRAASGITPPAGAP